MKKIKTAILISGRGSNMKSLVQACKNPNYPAEISLIISNKKNAKGLEFAKKENIPTFVVDHKDSPDRENFDQKVSQIIENHYCKLICLAGFMRLLSNWFVQKWFDRLINIHPSYLPDFKGANAVHDAINAKAKFSGCTVHFVRTQMDSGPIIKQQKVDILDKDTQETLGKRILEKEHEIYPQALLEVCNKILSKSYLKNQSKNNFQ
jgi:phosphoribosylglycinamide formyltransferase-1